MHKGWKIWKIMHYALNTLKQSMWQSYKMKIIEKKDKQSEHIKFTLIVIGLLFCKFGQAL